MYICIYMYIYTYIYIYIYIHTIQFSYINIYVQIYTYKYTCMNICTYIYICIYMYTYIHIYYILQDMHVCTYILYIYTCNSLSFSLSLSQSAFLSFLFSPLSFRLNKQSCNRIKMTLSLDEK